MGRPRSFLEKFDNESSEGGGIVIEGFNYSEDFSLDEATVPSITWKEMKNIKTMAISDVYETLEELYYERKEDLEASKDNKVFGVIQGIPKIFYVRPDKLSKESGYVIVWAEEFPEMVVEREEAREATRKSASTTTVERKVPDTPLVKVGNFIFDEKNSRTGEVLWSDKEGENVEVEWDNGEVAEEEFDERFEVINLEE